MARYRRRYGRRRNRRVKKSTALARKGARAQASQILTLQRQVDRIRRNTKDNTKYTQYQYPLSMNVGALTGPDFGVWNLINPHSWSPIFQTRSSAVLGVTPDKFRGRSIGLEMMFQIGQLSTVPEDPSQDPVTCTMFIVSLRKEVAKQFVHDTSNGVDLEEGVHYAKANMGTLQGSGMVFLNKGIFKIRHCRRFMIGGVTNFYQGEDAHTANLKDNNRRVYIRLPYRNLIKDDGPDARTAGGSGFRTLTLDDVEPHDQLYVYVFANSYADQSVAVHGNMVVTGTIAN